MPFDRPHYERIKKHVFHIFGLGTRFIARRKDGHYDIYTEDEFEYGKDPFHEANEKGEIFNIVEKTPYLLTKEQMQGAQPPWEERHGKE